MTRLAKSLQHPGPQALPLVGAAMTGAQLAPHRDWLMAGRDLELKDAVSHLLLDGDWQAQAAAIKARRSDLGLTGRLGIHGPFWGLTIMVSDPAVRALSAARLTRALEFASAVEATHMVIHSPFDFFGHPLVAHTRATGLDEQLSQVHDTIGEVVKLADDLGCLLVVENIRDLNPAPLLALVRSFGSASVRVSVDVGHAHLMQRKGGPSPDQWILEAGDLLAHVHLHDNDGQLDRHWVPGEGSVNWGAVFRALRQVGGVPRLIMELQPEALEGGARWLAERGLAQ
ncbi:sugar phosphate isomerase/epimerase [Deinococcus sp.]|uniref:sugar phosphate isomerase/epimerase family protein n=1 Tax=Deinococcus sp. TaxID=47478 RepID=UPI0025F13402|nr:sugar phosphate isomerase/epimerase [Deinococcus sp.]